MACVKLIKREKYIERLANLRGTPDIKIITGVRRAGKSKLLEAFRDQLSSEDGVNIVFIDLSCLENEKLLEYHALNEYVLAKTRDGVENVLMIDEVQECKGFERVINSLHNAGKYDIYLTGSNAFLLSSDLATLFTGRQIEVPVYPFSFSEFLRIIRMRRTKSRCWTVIWSRAGLRAAMSIGPNRTAYHTSGKCLRRFLKGILSRSSS